MKLSLCVITKNEAMHIGRCIESVRGVVDEIIVVDTGSIDDTVAIAKSLGARVVPFVWVDDFSRARNAALEQASGEWIIFLDADEYVKAESVGRIRSLLKEAREKEADALFVNFINIEADESILGVTKSIRLFKKHEDVLYVGAIHEYVAHKKRNLRTLDATDSITVYHTGYTRVDEGMANKAMRNLEILLKEEEKDSESATIAYYIAQSYIANKKYDDAFMYTKKVEEYGNLTVLDGYVTNKYYQLNAAIRGGKPMTVIQDVYKEAVDRYPEYPDYDFAMAIYWVELKKYDDAVYSINQAIKKMRKYKGVAESHCMGKLESLYEVLSKIYIGKGSLQDAVGALVNLVKLNKYNVYGGYNLLRLLLKNESIEAVYGFMMKIYDKTSNKDMLFLMEVAKQLESCELIEMLYKHLDGDGKHIWDGSNS